MSAYSDGIVIGGGVIGLSVAFRLARDGIRVTVLERDRCGAESSWAGAGVLAPCNPHRRDPVAALRQRSLSLYPSFCAELLDETGVDPEFDACGELEIALTQEAAGSLRSDATAGKDRRLTDGRPAYEFHDPIATRRIEPLVAEHVFGSLECRETSQVRNPRLLRALRTGCDRTGVEVREGTPVIDFALESDRVVGVRTVSGALPASFVVLCAGAWSSQIGGRLKLLMPVCPVRGQMILCKFDRPPFRRILARGKTYLVPRRDGHVLLGATEEHESGYAKRVTAEGLHGLIEKAVQLVPSMAEAPIAATWAGLRPGTPDDDPYIGPVPGFDGLIAATGHFRAGLILAPVTAEIISAIVHQRPYDIDITPCSPGRLTDHR